MRDHGDLDSSKIEKVSVIFRNGAMRQGFSTRRSDVHNKQFPQTYLLFWVGSNGALYFLDNSLGLVIVSNVVQDEPNINTFVATVGFLTGVTFFLVTPTGLLALTAGAFFVVLFAPVLAVARFLLVATSGTVSNTLGREFPVIRFSIESMAQLRAELEKSWRR
jgi:hypothetical protein